MDNANARLITSCLAAVAATALTMTYLGGGGRKGASLLSWPRRRVLDPTLRNSLALWHRLDLRALQSMTYLLAAFGPDGVNAPGAAPGCMVASPSRPDDRPGGKDENENYFFQWPRDSALCLREVIRRAVQAQEGHTVGLRGENADQLHRIIREFATMSIKLQHTDNRSGTFATGGIGEPKFHIDGSPFEDDWGRPQNDGPSLRAISMLAYAHYLLSLKDSAATDYVKTTLYSKDGQGSPSLVKNDLDYVARAWKDRSFELWEEVEADHAKGGNFHTLMVQRRCLLAGARFAEREEIDDQSSAEKYRAAAEDIAQHLEQFWNPEGRLDLEGGPQYKDGPLSIDWNDARKLGKIPKALLHRPHVIGTLHRTNGQPKPCQVDTAVLLGFLHSWDGDLTSQDKNDVWVPWSNRCLLTLDRLVEVFAVVYPINAGRSTAHGVMCGRYPEDVYDGVVQSIAHAWFLCTHAVSEVLSITAHHYAAQPALAIEVTKETQSFWAKVAQASTRPTEAAASTVSVGQHHRGEPIYETLMAGLWAMADNYLAVCDEYVGRNDLMSEQVHRQTGQMRGARELSWSYASFLSATAARQGRFLSL